MAKWVALIICSALAVIAIISFLLARIYLKTKSTITASSDRGIRRFKDANGVGILYVPALQIRKYIKQYILYEQPVGSILRCKIADTISYIHFDIICFDNMNNILSILEYKELITNRGYTQTTHLPEGTAYITFDLHQVNNEKFDDKKNSAINKNKLIQFSIISTLLILAECFIVKYSLSQLTAGIFSERFNSNIWSILITVGIGLLLGAATSAAVFLTLKYKSKKG